MSQPQQREQQSNLAISIEFFILLNILEMITFDNNCHYCANDMIP